MRIDAHGHGMHAELGCLSSKFHLH